MKSAQYPLPLPHHEAMEAEDLMVTASNRAAVAWLDRWPDWSAHCLVIYGPPASGKTHLLHIWQMRASAEKISAEEIKVCDLAALSAQLTALAIDDAEKIAGDPVAEENLFHLYNILKEKKGFLLLTAKTAPAHCAIGLKDLSSRLLASPAVTLLAPDDVFLGGLLVKQFRDRQLNVDAGVIEFILDRLTRSPAAIRDFVAALDAASLAENRRISVGLVKQVFANGQAFSTSSL